MKQQSREDSFSDEEPENVELYIMNPKNIPIKERDILEITAKYGLKLSKIKNMDMFQTAMTHSTYLVRDPDYKPDKKKKQHGVSYKDLEPVEDPSTVVPLRKYPYERLEFLGDAVLHIALTDYFFHRYPGEDEGFMSRLRTKIENKKSLAWLCGEIGLNRFILISQRMEMFDARNTNDGIMEDSFEAFLGALYEEIGFQKALTFTIAVIETHFDMTELLQVETNYKDTLLQYYHQMRWKEPLYGECDTEGPDHKKWFTMYVTDSNGRRLACGKGLSKKEGEQQAAKKALIFYGLLKKDELSVTDTDLNSSDNYSEQSDEEEDLAALYQKIKNTR